MIKNREQGFATAAVMAGLLAISFIASLAFGLWAFVGMQENKSDLNEKIEAASQVAVEKAETAKETEFAEKEKDPFVSYTGSETYGSVSFRHPKTWSVYLIEKDTGTVLDFYAHPKFVNGSNKDASLAFRAQIVSSSYTREKNTIEQLQDKGSVNSTAFRPKEVPSTLGVRVTGEIRDGKQGVMVVLPLRDKTLKIWTESPDYVKDFNRVIETLSFAP